MPHLRLSLLLLLFASAQGLKCDCSRCSRNWGRPGEDAQFFPADSPFSRGCQDRPTFSRALGAKPDPRQARDGIDQRKLSEGGDRSLKPTDEEREIFTSRNDRGSGGKTVNGMYGDPEVRRTSTHTESLLHTATTTTHTELRAQCSVHVSSCVPPGPNRRQLEAGRRARALTVGCGRCGQAYVFTIKKCVFGDEHKKVPLLPGEYA